MSKKDDMSIISLLARSKKRIKVLKSLENEDKIPSKISKDIDDNSNHVSKYLKSIRNLKNLAPLDIVELIPIKETRLYVKHVLRALFTYQKKFSQTKCYDCSSLYL